MPIYTDIPDRASDISDREFFETLRVPARAKNVELLREAVALGKARRFDDAYAALAAHHRLALSGEWDLIRQSHAKSPAPHAAKLRDLLDYKINAWHLLVVSFKNRKIDWHPEWIPSDCRHGFHYMGWMQPAVTKLIQTGDAECRRFLIDLLDSHYAARTDPRWKTQIRPLVFSMLGIAGRTGRFLAAYLALLSGGEVPPRTVGAFLKQFLGFARHLDHLLQKFIPANNAFCVGNFALMQIARTFPEFSESKQWDKKSVGFVAQLAREGFYADGGNLERVWGYGLMHVAPLAQAYELGQRLGGGLGRHDKLVLDTLKKCYQWYAKTAGPGPRGLYPTYGDAGMDNGLSSIRDASRFFPQPEKPHHLLGIDRRKSYLLEPSGFAAMRSGDGPDDSYINVSFGPFAGWHSHWDLLSMNVWSKGVRLLEEQCRFGPYANPLDTLFRAPESHNLCLIDGMIYDSRDVKGENVAWHSDERVDYFSATHRAYRYFVYGRGGTPVSPNIEALVRRTIVLVKDAGYVLVLDSVCDINHAIFNRAITQHWHSPFPFEPLGRDRARIGKDAAALMLWTDPQSLHRLDAGVDFAGKEVAHLGTTEDRFNLRARRWMPLDHAGKCVGFTTLIVPFRGKTPKVALTQLPIKGAGPWQAEAVEVTGPAGTDRVLLNPESLAGVTLAGRKAAWRARIELGRGRGTITVK